METMNRDVENGRKKDGALEKLLFEVQLCELRHYTQTIEQIKRYPGDNDSKASRSFSLRPLLFEAIVRNIPEDVSALIEAGVDQHQGGPPKRWNARAVIFDANLNELRYPSPPCNRPKLQTGDRCCPAQGEG